MMEPSFWGRSTGLERRPQPLHYCIFRENSRRSQFFSSSSYFTVVPGLSTTSTTHPDSANHATYAKRKRPNSCPRIRVTESLVGMTVRKLPESRSLVDEFLLCDFFLFGGHDSELDSCLLLQELSYAEQVLDIWIPTTA